MQQYTIEEYTKIHGFDFYVYDETIEDYLFGDNEQIDPEHLDWERVKDEIITGIDTTVSEEKTTLIITTLPEEESEWLEDSSGNWEDYFAELEWEAERGEKCLSELFGE